MTLNNTILYILGYPAAGKLTVARKLASLLDARLIDNHAINNSIFQIVRSKDGHVVFNDAVNDRVRAIRAIVLEAVENLPDLDDSFIFTNVLIDTPSDAALYAKIKELAHRRGARFIPVIIHCDADELIRRVQSPERGENLKLTRVARLKEILAEHRLLPVEDENLLEIDNTKLTADECARAIVEYVMGFERRHAT
jgi:shikimate kinase